MWLNTEIERKIENVKKRETEGEKRRENNNTFYFFFA